jgi:serine/threonine protein kinase
MHQVLEALVDEAGRVYLSEPVRLTERRRALVIVFDEESSLGQIQTGNLHAGVSIVGAARYRIDRPLGQGGMGQTFVGTDIHSGQTVCIKRLRPGMRGALIVQEWHSLSRVDSRFVVRFLDRYEHRGSLHLVMEYVEGPTLADRLQTALSADEVTWLALALMRGVEAFHQHEVIHCDLKPQNVLIEQETLARQGAPAWTPKIIDFGLAVLDMQDADGNITAEGRMAGTPAYMAPEQVRGWMLSPACDVYAVGLILWEALTGRRAFTGDSHSIMAAKLNQTAGLRVEKTPPGVPVEVGELVARCTHPDPSGRPSASEAAELFQRCGPYASCQSLVGTRLGHSGYSDTLT